MLAVLVSWIVVQSICSFREITTLLTAQHLWHLARDAPHFVGLSMMLLTVKNTYSFSIVQRD